MGNKLGAKKLTIIITKDGLTQIGTTTEAAEELSRDSENKVTSQTIRNWNKAGHKIKAFNDYIVYLNCKNFKD